MDAPSRTFDDLQRLSDEALAAFDLDQFGQARDLYLEILRTCDGLMDTRYRIAIRRFLGVSYYRLGDFQEAARIDRETLKLLSSGDESELIVIRHNLARDLSAIHALDPPNSLDGINEAIALHRTNVAFLRGADGREDELLEAKYTLAFDLANLSKSCTDTEMVQKLLEEAADLNRQVVQAREQTDLTGPLTIQSRHNLASVLYSQKKYTEAKQLLLQNQQHLMALPSAERKDYAEFSLSTDQHLSACCEATKDVNLSILQLTSKVKKHRKSGKATDGSSDRQISAGFNTPIGLGIWSKLPEIKTSMPFNGLSSPSNYSGIITKDNSRVHMGAAYTIKVKNVNKYYDSPALGVNHKDHSSPSQPQTPSHLEPPKLVLDGATQSSSQHRSSSRDATNNPRPPSGSSSTSSLSMDHLSPEGTVRRSKIVSRPHKPRTGVDGMEYEPGGGSSIRLPSDIESRESDIGQEETTRSRSFQQATLLIPGRSGRSRTLSASRTQSGLPDSEVVKEADKWFSDLRDHTHALLHYDNESQIPQRRRVRVAIIGSGLDRPAIHSKRRADIQKYRYNFSRYKAFNSDISNWTDSDSSFHGTNCASILLQVAPHADLFIANVAKKSTGATSASSVGDALEWALGKQVDIITLTVGFDTAHDNISTQIKLAQQAGILIFAAASNDGPNAPDRPLFPASLPNVFCINAANVSGARSLFDPISTGNKSNFMFLGENIGILVPNDKGGTTTTLLPGTSRLTGTSFATPIAAGTAALVLDLVRMQKLEEEHSRIEARLKTYEGMAAVFKKMSSSPTTSGVEFYNVRPWRLLGKKGPPPSMPNEPNESRQWYTLLKVVECLGKLEDLNTGEVAASCDKAGRD